MLDMFLLYVCIFLLFSICPGYMSHLVSFICSLETSMFLYLFSRNFPTSPLHSPEHPLTCPFKIRKQVVDWTIHRPRCNTEIRVCPILVHSKLMFSKQLYLNL